MSRLHYLTVLTSTSDLNSYLLMPPRVMIKAIRYVAVLGYLYLKNHSTKQTRTWCHTTQDSHVDSTYPLLAVGLKKEGAGLRE